MRQHPRPFNSHWTASCRCRHERGLDLQSQRKIPKPREKRLSNTLNSGDFGQQWVGPIKAHYQVSVRRLGAAGAAQAHIANLHVSGHGARVNIGSNDSSINVVSVQAQSVFTQARETIQREISAADDQRKILAKLDELQEAHGKPSFTAKYKEFVSVISDHIQVLGPVVAALAQLLGT